MGFSSILCMKLRSNLSLYNIWKWHNRMFQNLFKSFVCITSTTLQILWFPYFSSNLSSMQLLDMAHLLNRKDISRTLWTTHSPYMRYRKLHNTVKLYCKCVSIYFFYLAERNWFKINSNFERRTSFLFILFSASHTFSSYFESYECLSWWGSPRGAVL